MRLLELDPNGRVMPLSLQGAVGLAGFVSRGGVEWGSYMTALHEAFRLPGAAIPSAPTVEVAGEAELLGSPPFEADLASTLEPIGLSREEYGAVWFGAGSVERWLGAGQALVQGPEATRQATKIRAILDELPGRRPRSPADWLEQLIDEALGDTERLGGSEEELRGLEERLRGLRGDAAEVAGDIEVGLMAWVRERQDAETRLLLYRDRERELRKRLEALEAGGADLECEICRRPLAECHEPVLSVRSEEWEAVVQDGRWWRRRRDQLEYKPDELKDAEGRLLELEAEIDETVEAIERMRVQIRELEMARVRLQHLEALAERMGEVGSASALDDRSAGEEDGSTRERLEEMHEDLASSARRQLRERVHGKVVALTDGRLIGAFPTLYEDWSEGGRRGGGEVSILELAVRICLAELALGAGLPLETVVFPTALDRLNEEDLPRALVELGRLARRAGLVLVKATEEVASSAPERFDLLFKLDRRTEGPRVTRQRSGVGLIYLRAS